MPSRLFLIFVCALVLCVMVSAAESESWSAPGVNLPDPVAQVFAEGVSAAEFRAAVRAAAVAQPMMFSIKTGLPYSMMLSMESARLKIPEPMVLEIGGRLKLEIKNAGGEDEFSRRLRSAGMTVHDVRLMLREGLLLERIIRQRNDIAPDVKPADEVSRTTLTKLQEEYRPEYFGLKQEDSERVATIGGRNITSAEAVEWLVGNARGQLLEQILNTIVEARVMRITATGDGIDTKGKTTGEIEKEFLGQPDDKELAAYAKKLGDELDIIRVRHVFAAFDHRRGAAYRNRAFTQEEISRAKLRAEALFDKLDKGELTFDLAVKDHSDCPSAAVGGDLGYLAASFDVVLGIPPKAYLLDYLRLPGGQRTPLATAPDPAIYEAAKMITDGEMSRPVRTATGFSVIMRDETRKLTDLDVAADYLRRRWLSRKRAEIIAKARNDGQVKILWSPSRRHQISGSGSGNWVESR